MSEIRTSDNLTTALTWDILYGDGVVISENRNGEQTSYTYGLERISATTGSTRTEYVYDGRGSVAAEVSYNNAWYTLGGGLGKKAVNAKSYTPFGEQLGEAMSGYGYNGEYYNAATGMIYLRARFYAPEMNRFSQKDTLRGSVTQPGSLNRYLYCQNDPVNFMDPSGMRQVAGMYGDGTGRTAAQPKQTTPIITKPSQSANASIPVKNRTAPVRMTDTGTGSYTSSNNAAKNATRAVSNNAINGYKDNANTPTSSGTSIAPSTARPAVDIQTALSRSCAGSRKVTQVGNQIVYNGKIYNIPSGSPITNWTPELVERYLSSSQFTSSMNLSESCYDQNLVQEGEKQSILIWHIDSKAELIVYSVATVAVDVSSYIVSVYGVVFGIAALPETVGASAAIALASLERFSMAGVDIAYDIASIKQYSKQFEENGEVDVNKLGFVIPSILVDLLS